MELNLSTFVFEAINFLVLVWLLKRLLYRPVLKAISTRKKAVEQTLTEAEKVRSDATQLQKTYEDRLAGWERDKETRLAQLHRELEEERTHAMAVLERDLSKEREKQKALDERRLADLAQRQEDEALDLARQFSSRLLARLAGSELEGRIVDLFLDEIKALPEERLRKLKDGFTNHIPPAAEVRSAFPLTEGQKKALGGALSGLAGNPISCRFGEDQDLIAGLRVMAGPLVLRANLRDELNLFLQGDTDGD